MKLWVVLAQAAAFPAVTAAIDKAIAALEGEVLPKLNWSCPKVLHRSLNPLGLKLPSSAVYTVKRSFGTAV